MRPASPRVRKAIVGVAVLVGLVAAHWVGYRSGYESGKRDQGPQHRALVVVSRTKGNPTSGSLAYTWFDINDPRDAARLAKEEQRLKAVGAEYYLAKGVVESTLRPEPILSRVNSHR